MLTRSEWGARAPRGPGGKRAAAVPVPIAQRTEFVVHYDGDTPIRLTSVEDVKAHMRGMQKFHQGPERGWSDVGYNLLVVSAPGTSIDGLVVEGRGRDVAGAHCPNHNTAGIGVQVMIGGKQQPSPAALNAVRSLYDKACADAGHKLRIMGHRDGYSTDCPGPNLYPWVLQGLPRPVSAPPPPDIDPWVRQERPIDDIWDTLDTIQLYMARQGLQRMANVSTLSLINALRGTWKLAPVQEPVYGRDLVRCMQAWAGKLDQTGTLDGETARRVILITNRLITGKAL